MAWLVLLCAGIFEVIGVVGFARISHGQRLSGGLITVVAFTIGLACLHVAMQTIPMAVAYGIFTGIGAVGSTLVGIVVWHDSARPGRLAWIGGVVVAVIGLKLTM